VLLAGLFSGLASINTSSSRSFVHALTWGINLAIMTNILQFVFNKTRQSRKDYRFMRKWGPFFCILASIFLCMADLTRHLVNDAWGAACTDLPDGAQLGIFNGGSSPEMLGAIYYKYCKSVNVPSQYTSTGALSVWGWTFTIFCTWTGFVLLFVGICWVISLPRKVAAQWRTIRRRRAPSETLV